MNNGVVLIATVFKKYYDSACLLADSIKQYYPNCKVTLFTEEKFVNKNSEVFDSVITDLPNTPDDEALSVKCRAKMWGMANTPYDVTLYLDSDMMVVDEEFSTVFDKIKDNEGRYFAIICSGLEISTTSSASVASPASAND